MVFYCLNFAIRHSFAIRFRHMKRASLPPDYRNDRYQDRSAAGFVRVAGNDGLPAWGEIPPRTSEELQADALSRKAALIAQATQIIDPLKDALDGGYIDDEDKPKLVAWQKYRYALTKVDTANPVWPEAPSL